MVLKNFWIPVILEYIYTEQCHLIVLNITNVEQFNILLLKTHKNLTHSKFDFYVSN